MGNDTVGMFAGEQEAFVSLIRGLTAEQWEIPSLCPGWTVRDVVVHAAFHSHRGLRVMHTLGALLEVDCSRRADAASRFVQQARKSPAHRLPRVAQSAA
jgi:uncharacterized protein (TIGR03083 family)